MNNSIEIYHSQDGSVQLNVKLEKETVWLSANQMAMLFDRDAKTIRKHINNVFADGELAKESNTHFLRVANSDKPVPFYNLDVIISVGYRVGKAYNSANGQPPSSNNTSSRATLSTNR